MSDIETQLAEAHAALEQSAAAAAALRKAIQTYLGDVTIDASYLQEALRETSRPGAAAERDLRELQHRTL